MWRAVTDPLLAVHGRQTRGSGNDTKHLPASCDRIAPGSTCIDTGPPQPGTSRVTTLRSVGNAVAA
ncbi:hypothetical protein XhhCFBP4925_09125 [Xanthomonas hortorum pv. hederae]|nr:hypothetical protein XhhCFBP4925_09125 [Xanthomonas hortorum pv. hederae]PUF00380.1 hypothetical protein C7T87_08835 [Xanthomonas hortorum pv. hederae]